MQYQPYPEYQESNIEWLGDIPNHWEVRRLKFAVSHNDETLPETTEPDYLISYVDISSVNLVDGITYSEDLEFGKAPSRARRKVKDQDTIVSTVRTYLKAIAAIKKPPENLIVSTGFAVLRPCENTNGDFLAYYAQSQGFVGAVVAHSVGVSYPAINASQLVCLSISLPEFQEQQTIARFLDYKTQQIDQLIAKKQTLIDKLNEQRIALITHAVTKGLNPDVEMKDSGVEWLGDVPKHWEIQRAKFISKVFVPQRNKPELNMDKDGVPWVTMDNMGSDEIWDAEHYVSIQAASEADSKSLAAGAVIASCVGNFGVASINRLEIIINQQLQAFIPIRISAEYLRYIVVISKSYFELIGTAATLIYVNRFGFEEMLVSLPLVEEQQEIVAYLDRETARIDRMVELNQQTIDKLKEYRTALITAAVTGKIDVRKWQEEANHATP